MLLTTTRPGKPAVARKQQGTTSPPRAILQTIAVGLGVVQLLLDAGQVADARATLRAVRGELQALRCLAS